MKIASQSISHDVLHDKYMQPGEQCIDDVRRRIARALSCVCSMPRVARSNRRPRDRATGRADGRAVLRSPGHRGVRRRQGGRRIAAFQPLGGHHRRVHARTGHAGGIDLLHAAEPGDAQKAAGARQRADGLWCYARLPAHTLWHRIVSNAHGHGEPGLLFLDRINADNNLACCETISATNPCGEQPLPSYGACCLGSIDLTRLVERPFESTAHFDVERLVGMVPVAVRMLDNVLDLTAWPLPEQCEEARSKRRVGLGFTGLGDALVMLGLRYDSEAARGRAARVACAMRDAADAASVGLAQERGSFPRFDANALLDSGSFASRLPQSLQQDIRQHGLRNSHLLSIAPAGSVSLPLPTTRWWWPWHPSSTRRSPRRSTRPRPAPTTTSRRCTGRRGATGSRA